MNCIPYFQNIDVSVSDFFTLNLISKRLISKTAGTTADEFFPICLMYNNDVSMRDITGRVDQAFKTCIVVQVYKTEQRDVAEFIMSDWLHTNLTH